MTKATKFGCWCYFCRCYCLFCCCSNVIVIIVFVVALLLLFFTLLSFLLLLLMTLLWMLLTTTLFVVESIVPLDVGGSFHEQFDALRLDEEEMKTKEENLWHM